MFTYVIVTDYVYIIIVKHCKMYQVITNAVHGMLLSWWLYTYADGKIWKSILWDQSCNEYFKL